MQRIVSILPKGEGFSPQHFGAIALCLRDFTLHSRFRDHTTVVGAKAGESFAHIRYASTPKPHWWENRTRGYARQCVNIIRQEQATLVEVHNRPHMLRLIAAKISCPIALHLHNDPQEMQGARTVKERSALLATCSAIYCVSHYIRDRFLEGLPAAAMQKLHVIYNGIEIPASMRPKEKLIVFAGRITQDKGALLMAQALALALPALPGWRAVMIGGSRHETTTRPTPYEKQVMDIMQNIPAAELAGFLPHTQTLDLFARASIAVIPSLWAEPFGRTALEAMAYGASVISSGNGGLKEVTGDAAVTPTELTPESLAGAILILAENPGECERLQMLGRKRALNFSIASCTRTLDDVRDSILTESTPYAA